ncbi:MAG: Mu transposase C-terminal domain-containing protein [Pleurocapsa sp. MO_226.B13]|nr:Mu transposase C-terminal domain-containing protein [Pleurocapsa sp. MO_226.B13]
MLINNSKGLGAAHASQSHSNKKNRKLNKTDEDINSDKKYRLPSEELITEEVKLKMEIVQSLTEPCDRATYSQRKKAAAKKLGVSIRSIERLLKKYREQGLVGLTKTRSDKGQYRIGEDWENFILETYKKGNKNGKRITRNQVFLKVKGQALQLGLDKKDYPSHQTVYRILDRFIEDKQKKLKARSAGYVGSRLTHMTRDGRELEVEGSNDVWQCDHTRLDIRLVDEYGVLDRPWLTIIIDSYSRCPMGFYLGFDAPSSNIDALALRHAILPKYYGSEYQLKNEWTSYGKPNYFYTDGGKDFRSIHITEQVAVELEFSCALRRRPSDGGIVERFFRSLNDRVLRGLPGYTGRNIQERPKDVDKNALLTIEDLEQILVRYIVDEYNQKTDARSHNQSRMERWEAGLLFDPYLYEERDLDIALMKQERRKVQKYGTINFESLVYKSEHLKGIAGETVSIRYDPQDITTILVYKRLSDSTEQFLDYAHAQGIEDRRLSLRHHQAIKRKVREEGEEVNNQSILAMLDREEFIGETVTKNLQQRRQTAHETVNPVKSVVEKLDISEPEVTDLDCEEDEGLPPPFQVKYMDDLFEDD